MESTLVADEQVTEQRLGVPELLGWMSLPDVASALGVSRQQVHNMMKSRNFRSVRRIGSSSKPFYVFRASEIERLVAARHQRLRRPELESVDSA